MLEQSLLPVALVMVLAAGIAHAQQAKSNPTAVTVITNKAGSALLSPIAGVPRPTFALPSLDGPLHDLAQHRGQVVLVHFFATWCEPCGPELASLRGLQSRLAGRPFTILAISVAEADSAVRRYFASDPSPFVILLDRDRSITKAWSVQTLPTTIVLDHQSKPRFLAEGDVNWARTDVTSALADLLADVPGSRGTGGG
jgi:peroxiredoxin